MPLFTKPGATSWEVYFYNEADGGGTPATWDPKVSGCCQTLAQVQKMPMEVGNLYHFYR